MVTSLRESSMTQRKDASKDKRLRSSSSYTSKIIKASALLDDTKTLLSHWDATASVPENLDRIRRENVFAKASRSRVEDILAVFRQRYLVEADVVKALVVLVKNRFPAASLDRVLYFHAARATPCCTMPSPRFWCRCRPRASPTSTPWRFRRFLRSGSRKG